MKKKLLFLLLIMLFPIMANAKTVTVTSFDEVKANNVQGDHLEFTGSTLKLTEDITLKAFLDIKANTTLDLNGHTLTLPDTGNNYALTVFNSLTINGDGKVTVTGNFGITTTISTTPKITINGGTFEQIGDYYMFGITNGELVINDGTFYAPYCVANSLAKATMAEYNIQGLSSKITINGGTFTTDEGWDAPIMNSDVVVINNGTFTSSGEEGYAVYTDPTGTTTITGGTFTTTGTNGVTVYNEGTTVIEGGSFESSQGNAIENETASNANASLTLVGGSFSDSANSVAPFVDDQSVQYTNTDGDSVVVPKNELVLKSFAVAADASEGDLALIKDAMSEGFTLASTFDVTVWKVNPADNAKVEQLTETDDDVEVTLDVSNLPAVADGYTREFEVVKVHNGEAEAIQAEDNGNGTISCDSSEFSTYAVTYKDSITQNREDENEATPTSGNPKTGDSLLLIILFMMIGLVGSYVTSKKLANR